MADVKVNGNIYRGITHIQLAPADGGDLEIFIEGEGQWTTEGIATGAEPSGDIVLTGTVVNAYAFAGSSITGFEAEELTKVGDSAFEGCKNLVTVKCRNMIVSSHSVFSGCNALKNVDIVATSTYGSYFFKNCTALEELTLYGSTGQGMTSGCTALKKIDMHAGDLAGYLSFEGCSALKTLILRQEAVAKLRGVDVFNGTPFASGGTGGTIYTHEALIESYKAAVNWSTLDGFGTVTWKAIEGSEYDGTI